MITTIGLEITTLQRRSDSGTFVDDEQKIKLHPLVTNLLLAKCFMNAFILFPEEALLISIAPQQEICPIDDLIAYLPSLKIASRCQILTKSIGATMTGGLANSKRWSAANQLDTYIGKP